MLNTLIFDELKKRWILLIICGLIGMGVLIGEYFFYHIAVPENEKIQEVVIFKVESDNVSVLEPHTIEFNRLFNSYPIISGYLKNGENKFDFGKFNLNWSNYSELEKLNWFQEHVKYNNMNQGLIELVAMLNINDPKDFSYSKSEMTNFIDDYILYLGNELKLINPSTQIKIIKRVSIQDGNKLQVKNNISLKYAATGGILGILIASSIITLRTVRKYYADRK